MTHGCNSQIRPLKERRSACALGPAPIARLTRITNFGPSNGGGDDGFEEVCQWRDRGRVNLSLTGGRFAMLKQPKNTKRVVE